mmetsp:Transcript_64484/g.135306  ORF Transcript_64484/g.135306 Transcript_64484/m.135306 type:complete len:384 (-) Transcript_64484:301-1452(-)
MSVLLYDNRRTFRRGSWQAARALSRAFFLALLVAAPGLGASAEESLAHVSEPAAVAQRALRGSLPTSSSTRASSNTTAAHDYASANAAQNPQQGFASSQIEMNPHEDVDIKSVLAALALLSGSFFLVLLGLRVYLHCVRRRPARRERKKKMTQEDVEARFPVVKCVQSDGETCVICLSNIEEGDECRITQCGHQFHADCVLSWWMYKQRRTLRCPMCRTRQKKHPKKKGDADATQENSVEAEGGDKINNENLSEEAYGMDGQVKKNLGPAVSPILGDRACSLKTEDQEPNDNNDNDEDDDDHHRSGDVDVDVKIATEGISAKARGRGKTSAADEDDVEVAAEGALTSGDLELCIVVPERDEEDAPPDVPRVVSGTRCGCGTSL